MLGALNGVDPIPYQINSKDLGKNFYLKLVTSLESYSFVKEKESLALLFEDDELVLLSHIGDPRRHVEKTNYGVNAIEEYLYPVDRSLIEKLSKSLKVEFAVYGEDGRIDRTMTKAQTKYYAEFLEKLPK